MNVGFWIRDFQVLETGTDDNGFDRQESENTGKNLIR